MDIETKKKIPTLVTGIRILLVPPILWIFIALPHYGGLIAGILFALAATTDYFDGYLARKWNAVSNYGKFMDPVADKILVSCSLILLVAKGIIDPFSVIIIISRDTYIGGLRSIAAADNIIIAAKPTGKWKAALQMGAIPVLMATDFFGGAESTLYKVAYGILWLSVILSLTSALEYHQGYKSAKSVAKK